MSAIGSLTNIVNKLLQKGMSRREILTKLKKDGHKSDTVLSAIDKAKGGTAKGEAPVLDNDTVSLLEKISKRGSRKEIVPYTNETIKDYADAYLRRRQGTIADKIAAQNKRAGTSTTPEVITGPPTKREQLIDRRIKEQEARIKKSQDSNLPILREKGSLASVSNDVADAAKRRGDNLPILRGKNSLAPMAKDTSEAIKKGSKLSDILKSNPGKIGAAGILGGVGVGGSLYLSPEDLEKSSDEKKLGMSVVGQTTEGLLKNIEEDKKTSKGPSDWERSLNAMASVSGTLPEEDKQEWDAKLTALKDIRDDAIAKNRWMEVAETVGHALAQMGAGYHGLRTGKDLSNIPFEKANWSRNIDQIIDQYKSDAALTEVGRGRAEREARDTGDARRRALLEKSKMQFREEQEEADRELTADKITAKALEKRDKMNSKELAALEKSRITSLGLIASLQTASSGKERKKLQGKLVPALVDFYTRSGIPDPRNAAIKTIEQAQVPGFLGLGKKLAPKKLQLQTREDTVSEDMSSMSDEELRAIKEGR